MTPRQSDALTRVVGGFFFVVPIGLLALLGRGYHTLVLILIGLMVGIGAITFFYDRRATLSGLAPVAAIGLLSLIMQGYFTLIMVIMSTIFGIGALAFIHQMWQAWYPDEHIGPLVRRYGFRLLQLLAVALAYIQARGSINTLTGVDPSNFPTALAALTALLAVPAWLLVIAWAAFLTLPVYLVIACVASLRQKMGFAELRGISPGGWSFRVYGVVSLMFICLMTYGLPAEHPWVQRLARIVASIVLVATEFSYDRTCAVSSKDRPVALLKYRREMTTSLVSIAEGGPFREPRFTIGTCDQATPP